MAILAMIVGVVVRLTAMSSLNADCGTGMRIAMSLPAVIIMVATNYGHIVHSPVAGVPIVVRANGYAPRSDLDLRERRTRGYR